MGNFNNFGLHKYTVIKELTPTGMKTLVIPLGKSSRPAEVLVENAANLEWMIEVKMIIPVPQGYL